MLEFGIRFHSAPDPLTKDGVLVEGLLWKDVEALIKEYTGAVEPKKKR
ncbi:unnamed protein product [Brassica napus]|uniref:(rape) hypothetical protein n=1 Tax=Brassica napus TaxID=3708 RepID=A0A816VJT6_BRANA|nr:unnamed protein product [Brassica napus]